MSFSDPADSHIYCVVITKFLVLSNHLLNFNSEADMNMEVIHMKALCVNDVNIVNSGAN